MSSKILYNLLHARHSTIEIHTSEPPPESRNEDVDRDGESTPKLVVRSLSESFIAMNGNESLEITKRVLAFPNTMCQRVPELFAGSLEIVGEESPALLAMGLDGWEVSRSWEACKSDTNWAQFCFDRPKPKVPLAIFRLTGEFDLPGGDGGGEVSLGYVSTDLDYVVASRDFCEYPIYRWINAKVSSSWEEAEAALKLGCQTAKLPGLSREGTKMEEILAKTTTPDGWEVEHTTMYMDEKRCIMGSPHLAAVYKDAEGLAESFE